MQNELSNFKLILSYNGKNYAGWQRQPNALSIEEVILNTCKTLSIEDPVLIGAGRTDAGVHARGQCARLSGRTTIPESRIREALNANLPQDVRVVEASSCSRTFHPRYDAHQKTYRYQILIAPVDDPLLSDQVWHVPYELDVEKMKEASKLYRGEHDFSAYRSSGGAAKTSRRRIDEISFQEVKTPHGRILSILFTGEGFLYNMVRILVGTLVEVGLGRRSMDSIIDSLERGERKLAGKTAPAKGLILESVSFESSIR